MDDLYWATQDPDDPDRWWYEKFPPLTPWLPGEEKPVRQGVYMVDQSWPGEETQPVFSYWDGANWYPQDSEPDKAMRWLCYGPKKGRPFKQWRGLKGAE